MLNVENEQSKIIYYIKDISEKERLSQEIKQKENIINIQSHHVAMGQMIGNIAHQWRQPLSVITAATSGVLIQNTLGTLNNNDLESALECVSTQVDYLANTINTFRDFTIEQKTLKEINLNDEIKKSLKIIEPALMNNYINLKNEMDKSEELKTKIIAGELSQVIINIIYNAKDILVEKKIKKPWIKLTTQRKSYYAIIKIEDNAGGVPKEIINNIFEQYFTTKHKSQRTELGLYMSYKIIVESLKGKLYVKNSENGAVFHIELPLY